MTREKTKKRREKKKRQERTTKEAKKVRKFPQIIKYFSKYVRRQLRAKGGLGLCNTYLTRKRSALLFIVSGCVVHVKRISPPIFIQHNQCPLPMPPRRQRYTLRIRQGGLFMQCQPRRTRGRNVCTPAHLGTNCNNKTSVN